MAESSSIDRRRREDGFTLIEILICTLILTTGLIAIAGLLAVTTQMHVNAREAARSTRLAQGKIDDLMKRSFTNDAEIAVGGSLTADVANYTDTPLEGVTLRWSVANGPAADTRVLTVRVINQRAQQFGRQIDMSTILRRW